VTISLPYPPSTNHAYTVANGRKIKSATARAYAHEVGWRVKEQLRDVIRNGGWLPGDTGRLAATVDIYQPDQRRRDLENTTKLAIDAVAAAIGFDDSQIDVLTLRRRPVDRTNPRLVLTLEAIE